ncbi:hypothetical protein HK100_008549, partial [Physocladia obscura]
MTSDEEDSYDSEAEFLAHMTHNESNNGNNYSSNNSSVDGSGTASDSEGNSSNTDSEHKPSKNSSSRNATPKKPIFIIQSTPVAAWEVEMEQAMGTNGGRYFEEERKCSFCRKPGHDFKTCKEKKFVLSVFEWAIRKMTVHEYEQQKKGIANHATPDCGVHWRKYKLIYPLPKASKVRKFCYWCASDNHFGDNCTDARGGHSQQRVTAFNMNSVPKSPAYAPTTGQHRRFNDGDDEKDENK